MNKATFLALFGCCIAGADAATLSVADVLSSPNGTVYNLDDSGGLDWSVWKKVTGTDLTYNVATNTKASSTAISDLFLVGTTTTPGYRASTNSSPTWDFTYTGGVSPTEGTLADVNGVFHPDVAASGKGVGLTVTLPTTDLYRITLFVSGYDTIASLSASLSGATTVTNTSFTPGLPVAAVKQTGYFTIDARADAIGDVLTLELINTTNRTSSHVVIAAASVQVIPEPSSLVLLGAIPALGFIRRRRP